MAISPETQNGEIRELTREEGRKRFDREAHRYLGVSAEECIQAWDGGKFDDDPDRPDVMYIAMLLPLAR